MDAIAEATSTAAPVTAAGAVPDDAAALCARVAAGDEAAFVRFYEAWFGAALALARAAARRDEAFCLDVVQDVMMKVAKKLPPLPTSAAVGAWMARAVCRAVADRTRAEARRRRREAADGRAAAVEPEPWHGLVDAERRGWLEESLRELPPADRTLLLARFGDTTTVTAAAAELGLGADAAHGRLRRSLERLRRRAAEWWHG